MASNRFTELLNEFDALPPCPGRLPTIMEIAGYPHYENVCSNMLKFFFDPGAPHGLDTLLLDVLPRVGGHQIPEGAFGSDVSVEREVITRAGNRIDLLIRSDSYDILIENKIFAATANPFDDYSMYLRSLPPVDRQKLKFLLTLTRTNEGKEHGFQNITYGELVKGIRAQLGKYVAHADTRYLTFFLDFLNTLDNLQVGTLMSNGFLNLVSQRTRGVEAFLNEIKSLKDELRRKITALAALIDVRNHTGVRQWFWRQRWSVTDVLVHDIERASDLSIAIDTVISPAGWEVQIFLRHGGDPSPLRSLLRQVEIPFENGERFVSHRFPYGQNLGDIGPVVQNIVDKLASNGPVVASNR